MTAADLLSGRRSSLATKSSANQAPPFPDGTVAAYLAAIVESSDDAIVGKDLGGIIRSWNRGAEVIFGYKADEVIGRSVHLLFPPERLGEEDEFLKRIRRGERVDHFETIRRRKDGSDFPASVTISPIRDARGVVVGASKILRDISESHRAHRELQRAKADLEQVVLERTAALAQRNLLLSEVYHRVKNNLQVIDGLIVLQARKIEDRPARDAMMGLRPRLFALGLVHQQLMDSPDLMTFDVAPFLRELTTNIVEGAADDQIRLTVDACPLNVGLDFAVPLGLLVTEIVTNSLKHAFPAGVGAVSVQLRPDTGGRVVLAVSDNGRGMGRGAHAPVGLGSTIIRRLVAQLQGEMVVFGDAGTTTEISLPLPEVA